MGEVIPPSGERPRPGATLRLAFLHIAPRHDDLTGNLALLEEGIRQAAGQQADLILTPELAVSGYEFYPQLGKEWIRTQGPAIIEKFCRLARENHVALLLGCPTYAAESDTYHNSALLIDETGRQSSAYHKALTLPGSIEGWSAPGRTIRPLAWRGQKIGLLICADAYQVRLAEEQAAQGADVLVSLAAWAPGAHAPNGEWEQCTHKTGLCLYVCNRTGREASLDFTGSSSVVAAHGRRILEYSGQEPALLTLDVDPHNWQPTCAAFDVQYLK